MIEIGELIGHFWALAVMLAGTCIAGYPLAVLLGISGWFQHVRDFQNTAVEPRVSHEAWEALRWSGENLNPSTAYVANLYGTAGAYLPAVAGVVVTDW
ncbi:MAG: hypothetical protein KAU28_00030, partial [Phycisphaerae bacterium]|nr:hypothetical protein [Phycisphaerae bacterium]